MATLALGVVVSALIARSLSPEERGMYYIAVTFALTAIALGHLSVEQAQTALWPDTSRRAVLTANSVPLGLCIGAAAALAALAVAGVLRNVANLPDMWMVAMACAGVPLSMAVLYANNIAFLSDRAQLVAAVMLLGMGFQCLSLIVLGVSGRLTAYSVVVIWTIAAGVSLIVLIGGRNALVGRRADLASALTTCAMGVRFHPGSAAAYLLQRSDVFLLNALAGHRQVGIYSLAVTLAEMSRLVIDVVWQVTLSRQLDEKDRDAAGDTVRIIRLMVVLAIASALIAIGLTSVLVVPVYGHAYATAHQLLVLLLPGILLAGASRPAATYLLGSRSSRIIVYPSVAALILNIGLIVVLIPVWGAAGCAVATGVAYAALAVCQVTLFIRVTGISGRLLLPRVSDFAEITGRLRAASQ
ncbi:polysaccharide biosynthesis C-terminal domain-containing protein [Streptomyces sp. PSKA01]|uniref:Polysaccharide biosynthesis C-terminal domain-containing protein n=1 Tax=Streptomyces cupreus TaxID=2759956 RepID=A0A7X1J8H0_9ACTN|nr:polysaccharide biosynthesis C-terminal domain-containing protein [Streptomyces cupreus]